MKTLAIISKGKTTCQELHEQLRGLIGNQVRIAGYYLDGNISDNITADVVLLTGKHSYEEALAHVNPACPVILARRAINYHEVDQLFDLPVGTHVLLVNDLPSSAQDTISLLTALGINHLHYHPFAPGIDDYPRLKIAITPGEPDLIPPCVEQVINIKTRVIDITTLTEILKQLSLLDDRANRMSASYLHDIIDLIKKSKYSTAVSNKTKNQLQTIINAAYDGIIAVDSEKRVSVFNPVAENILGMKSTEIVGHRIDQLTNHNRLAVFDSVSDEKETFIKVNSRHLVVTSATIQDQHDKCGKVYTFKDVSEIQRLEEDLRRKLVGQQHIAQYTLDHIIGNSPTIKRTLASACKMAASNAPILIFGESGTGKELLAQGIHNASPRRNGPFVAVNFAAMTENLLESELFGYEEGSFTGARKGGSTGLFEQAHKGTIFLDEVGDAPLPFQVKLLRVLQEKQIRRVGGSRIIPIDVRVITATNKDLNELIRRNLFRQDLYYRLNVLPIKLPPLKERKEDILPIAKTFYNALAHNRNNSLANDYYFENIILPFLAYDWPGNIRELQNIIEYLVTSSPDTPPSPEMLTDLFQTLNRPLSGQHQELYLAIRNTIAIHNKEEIPIGRRTLAKKLSLPESVIRKALIELQQQGCIKISKGKRGLSLIKD